MKVAIGSDHKAIGMKESVKAILAEMGIECIDVGTNSEERVDYTDYGAAVARQVSHGAVEAGIAICASGVGMSIAANKVDGVRAVLAMDPYVARMSRLHNNTNVLCMGALMIGPAVAEEIVRTWLATEYEGGRHQRRLDKIADLERE